MLILHLVPVGLSLLNHLEQPVLARDELPGSAITVRDALRWAAGGPTWELDWARLELAGLPRSQAASDPADAAEWTSIAAITAERRHAAAAGHAYLFLATDTDDGLRAAALVAARYHRGTTRYLHEPLTAGRLLLEPGDVVICRIPDLNLGETKPTSTTWRSLGAIGRLVADTALQTARGEWEVVLHLSGGYKAMIPYLIEMAEGIHTRLRDVSRDAVHRPGIRAVVIHESSLKSGRDQRPPIVIDVPVRAIEGDLLAVARRLAEMARPHRDLVETSAADALLGLLIDRDPETDRKRRLTPAGLMMVTML